MRILEIDGYMARCEAKGVEREVSLFMLQDATPEVGDYVMVHVGYAIQVISPDYARSSWELLDEILVTENGSDA